MTLTFPFFRDNRPFEISKTLKLPYPFKYPCRISREICVPVRETLLLDTQNSLLFMSKDTKIEGFMNCPTINTKVGVSFLNKYKYNYRMMYCLRKGHKFETSFTCLLKKFLIRIRMSIII